VESAVVRAAWSGWTEILRTSPDQPKDTPPTSCSTIWPSTACSRPSRSRSRSRFSSEMGSLSDRLCRAALYVPQHPERPRRSGGGKPRALRRPLQRVPRCGCGR
jgi:hypothetical protein